VYRWLLRLYPRTWRARYEAEVAAVLEQHGCTPRTLVDLAAGALDARLLLPRFAEEELIAVNAGSHPVDTIARPGRTVLIVAVTALSAVFFLLLAYTMFVGFPTITHTGDAHLQQWLGPDMARWGYLALGLLVAGAYGMVAIGGNLDSGLARSRSVLAGAAVGVIAGLVAVGVLATVTLTATSPEGLTPSATFDMFLMLAAPLVAGAAAGRLTGRGSHGILAGFWCGVVLALLASTSLLVRDLVFAGTLDHTAWVGDRFGDALCNGVQGAVLADCEVGDDFGFAAFLLLVAPLLGGLVGGLGSLVASLGRQPVGQTTPRWSRSTIALAAFSGVMLALFVVELSTRLW
jgi:hypothetical protein